jgi:hypothetical protein
VSGVRPSVESPIIRSRVPSWMQARDVILTLGAWLVIAYFFRHGIARVHDYFSPPMFEFTMTSPADWAYRWQKLRGFVAVAVGLVLWIAFWAFDSRARMRALSSPQPTPLEPDAHARRVGLTGGDLELWRSERVQTVDIDATLQVISRTIPNPPSPRDGRAASQNAPRQSSQR